MEKQIKHIEELEAFAEEFLTTIRQRSPESTTIVALSGDLGAGKTTFVQLLAKQLGITEPVTSPTFTIMQSYDTTDARFSTLLHMDAYRIEDEVELAPLRFAEFLQSPQTLFCIEWAEKIKDALPKGTIFLNIEISEGEERMITISRVVY